MKKIIILLGLYSLLGPSLFAAGNFIIKNECPLQVFFTIHTVGKNKAGAIIQSKINKALKANSDSEVIDLERFDNSLAYIIVGISSDKELFKIDFENQVHEQPRIGSKNFLRVVCTGNRLNGEYYDNFGGKGWEKKQAWVPTQNGWWPPAAK